MLLATASTMDLSSLVALADKVMEVLTQHVQVAAINNPSTRSSSSYVAPGSTAAARASRPSCCANTPPAPTDYICDMLEEILVATTRRDHSPRRLRQCGRSLTPAGMEREVGCVQRFAPSLTSGAVDDEPLPLPICISASRQARLRPKITD
ncbi:hypothetical protein HPB50_007204 [Hyalomma asiaticum]|uniref:Uncharacterized protein n=1 Tax=Hyalomma asiaticum TaxID=266040 RepID=A0ACB7TDS1_HYAAI|nr:hypothetical protein HPB50_007204 [Hyalomma asiaticum]